MDPIAIFSQLVTGLSIASILLLVALGLAIIYGATGVINLAHGEFVMLGAYSAWALQTLSNNRKASKLDAKNFESSKSIVKKRA